MAQKETSSKSRRWLGLSGAAVLVANLVLTGTTIAFQQEGEVNHALGIEGAGASYGGTEFSADGTLSDASYEKYIEAAYQFCEQEEEEGSVLLYNSFLSQLSVCFVVPQVKNNTKERAKHGIYQKARQQ